LTLLFGVKAQLGVSHHPGAGLVEDVSKQDRSIQLWCVADQGESSRELFMK
jgi:hypothetical protein